MDGTPFLACLGLFTAFYGPIQVLLGQQAELLAPADKELRSAWWSGWAPRSPWWATRCSALCPTARPGGRPAPAMDGHRRARWRCEPGDPGVRAEHRGDGNRLVRRAAQPERHVRRPGGRRARPGADEAARHGGRLARGGADAGHRGFRARRRRGWAGRRLPRVCRVPPRATVPYVLLRRDTCSTRRDGRRCGCVGSGSVPGATPTSVGPG